MIPYIISDHFRRAYFTRVWDLSEDPLWLQDAKMGQHIREAEPVSDTELLLIRGSRYGRPEQIEDHDPGVRHLIDRDRSIVFLLKCDSATGKPLAVTCYVAAYLDRLQQMDKTFDEREEILAIFTAAKKETCAAQVRWCVAIHKLWTAGYVVEVDGVSNVFRVDRAATGLWILRRPIGGPDHKWKHLRKMTLFVWYRPRSNRVWRFSDFNVGPELEPL